MILDHLLRKRLGVAIRLFLDDKLPRLNLEHVADGDLVDEVLGCRGASSARACANAAAHHRRDAIAPCSLHHAESPISICGATGALQTHKIFEGALSSPDGGSLRDSRPHILRRIKLVSSRSVSCRGASGPRIRTYKIGLMDYVAATATDRHHGRAATRFRLARLVAVRAARLNLVEPKASELQCRMRREA